MIERFKQWFGMKRRGEVRVAPYPQTGRVFASKDKQSANAEKKFNAKATLVMTARVIRKDGTIEEIKVNG